MNDELTNEQQAAFRRYFGVGISPFWDGLFGFKVQEFGDWLVARYPEDEAGSIYDSMVKRYGLEAADFVMSLLHIMPVRRLYGRPHVASDTGEVTPTG